MSALAIALMAVPSGVAAETQSNEAQNPPGSVPPPQSQSATDATGGDVVVTGRRAAIESAIKRKENAPSIIDSVLADDAGKLPDNSITEVLQRVSGVSIVRFGSLGDPDHFSAEGSGLQVRGLSGVAGRLNGREIFSANGGRALSFQDVTPELMSAVDVYKSSTADLIEGGTGGQIDLRTKMPFDYKEFTVQGNVQGMWGDLRKKKTYGESGLITKTFDTGIGRIGFLVDVAQNKYAQRSDFFRMEPYYRTHIGSTDYFIPGGFDYGDQFYDRKRTGIYGAVQWQPASNLQLYATYFRSKYDDNSRGNGEFVVTSTPAVDPASSTFDSNNGLIKSTSLYIRDPATFNAVPGVTNFGGDTGISKGTSLTTDYSGGLKWDATNRLHISASYQHVRSTSTTANYDVFPGVNFPNAFGLDLSGNLPQVTVPQSAQAAFADPSAYQWQATMDHNANNLGKLDAGQADVEYDLSDDAFFRSFKTGVRYADRTEKDLNSGYNWTALGRGWNGAPQLTFADARPGDVEQQTFDNFFRGKAALPGNLLFPSFAMVGKYDVVGDHAYYGGNPVSPIGYGPLDLTNSETEVISGYLETTFKQDSSLFGWEMNGNAGVRVVHDKNTSTGFFQQNSTQYIRNGQLVSLPTVGAARSGGRTYTKVLPSVNIQLLPDPTVHLRFAYNVTLDNPSFSALSASGTLGVNTVTDPNGAAGGPGVFNGFTSSSGNPNLKPAISNNLDLSFEWYPKNGTAFHLALFHKAIENVLVYGIGLQTVGITNADGSVTQESVSSTNIFNSDKKAKVEGLELGGRTFFDMLPGLLSGFGVEANYTFIHSSNPGDRYLDIDGVQHNNIPLAGLSKHNLNATLLYEKGPVSARIAYSWRSRYLMATNTNGTNGTYTYYTAPGVGTLTQISLPIYSEPYGTIDAGVTIHLNKHLGFSIEGQNLTNEIAKTSMGGYPGGQRYIRSWFVSDRRVNGSINFSF